MKHIFPFFAGFLLVATSAQAEHPGKAGFDRVKNCVMQNDAAICRATLTQPSHELFDRFASYKLMPCLPTNFTYKNEEVNGGTTLVRATMPASNNRIHTLKLAFSGSGNDLRLDLPESLQRGLGEDWENKIQLAEQLFLFIRANSGGNFNCDQLNGLVKK